MDEKHSIKCASQDSCFFISEIQRKNKVRHTRQEGLNKRESIHAVFNDIIIFYVVLMLFSHKKDASV